MVKRVWIDSIHITWNNNYSFSTCEERERERRGISLDQKLPFSFHSGIKGILGKGGIDLNVARSFHVLSTAWLTNPPIPSSSSLAFCDGQNSFQGKLNPSYLP